MHTMGCSSGQLRNALKTATRDDHERVDSILLSWPLDDIDVYRQFLIAHARVLLPCERWLSRNESSTLLPEWTQRDRTAALLNDLHKLGCRPDIPSDMSFDNAEPVQIGMVYVLEGSRLGGFVLAKKLNKLRPDLPTSFLSYDADTDVWGRFVEWLNGKRLNTGELETSIDTARFIFRLYEESFSISVQIIGKFCNGDGSERERQPHLAC